MGKGGTIKTDTHLASKKQEFYDKLDIGNFSSLIPLQMVDPLEC